MIEETITEDDEEYAEFLSDVMLSYFSSQLQAGRTEINESELWQLLGAEFPEGREDKPFKLREFVGNPSIEILDDNIIDIAQYKKLH